MSYGTSISEAYRESGLYVGAVLNGQSRRIYQYSSNEI